MDLYYLKYLKYKNKYLKAKKQIGGMTEVTFQFRGKTLKGIVPDDFLCPISYDLMNNPVILSDGQSYEKDHIEKWFESHNTSPNTGLVLLNKTMLVNYALKGSIDDLKENIYKETIKKEREERDRKEREEMEREEREREESEREESEQSNIYIKYNMEKSYDFSNKLKSK
jgi:hypothetical protein